MHETPKPANRLSSVKALRALAASSVVFAYIVDATLRMNPANDSLGALWRVAWLGNFGVDVFFIISGFIISYAHYDDFGQAGAQRVFLTKRLIRIVPNYWLLTALATAIFFLAPQLSHYGREADVPWIIVSFLFFPWTSSAGIPLPVLGLGWTLNYEMYFYVVFAIVLLMPRRLALPVMTAFLLGSAGLGLLLRPEVPMLALMTSALLVEFLCGIWIARAFVQDVTLPAGLRGALGLAALAVLAVSPLLYTNGDLATWWRLPFFGLPAAALMAAVLLRPGLSGDQRARGLLNRLMVALGDSSYALYLTHVFTLRIAVIVGHLFFVLVERPVYRLLKARFLTRKITEVPA